MNNIMVIGSISTDFNVLTNNIPVRGETIKGVDFNTSFGGKGANQAVAASRLGASVSMVGTVGDDVFGEMLIQNLKTNNVDTNNVVISADTPSGSAHITLLDNDNSIIYIPGANDDIDLTRIEDLIPTFKTMDIVVIQNEIPIEVIKKIIDVCHQMDLDIIYNPAPAESIEVEYIDKVTYFTPNETEFNVIFPELTLEEGLKKYPKKMIVTLGAEGVAYYNSEEIINVSSYKVNVVDTTGAGDSFNGALAYALSEGISLESSIEFANLVAAISIGKLGAQSGSPTLDEVKRSDSFEEEWNSK